MTPQEYHNLPLFLRAHRVCEVCGIHRNTLHKYDNEGIIPSFVPPGMTQKRWKRETVWNWLQGNQPL